MLCVVKQHKRGSKELVSITFHHIAAFKNVHHTDQQVFVLKALRQHLVFG